MARLVNPGQLGQSSGGRAVRVEHEGVVRHAVHLRLDHAGGVGEGVLGVGVLGIGTLGVGNDGATVVGKVDGSGGGSGMATTGTAGAGCVIRR